MTTPTIYITDLTTSVKYKVIDVNKEAKTIQLLDTAEGNIPFEAPIAAFSGPNFKVEKVVEEPKPEPMTEQEEAHSPPKSSMPPYPFGEPEAGVTTDSTPEVVAEEATTVAQYATPLPVIYASLPTVTNRKEALALSEAYKDELKPILERMKAVKEAVECGHKGEAKKIAYVIQWCDKYLGE